MVRYLSVVYDKGQMQTFKSGGVFELYDLNVKHRL